MRTAYVFNRSTFVTSNMIIKSANEENENYFYLKITNEEDQDPTLYVCNVPVRHIAISEHMVNMALDDSVYRATMKFYRNYLLSIYGRDRFIARKVFINNACIKLTDDAFTNMFIDDTAVSSSDMFNNCITSRSVLTCQIDVSRIRVNKETLEVRWMPHVDLTHGVFLDNV